MAPGVCVHYVGPLTEWTVAIGLEQSLRRLARGQGNPSGCGLMSAGGGRSCWAALLGVHLPKPSIHLASLPAPKKSALQPMRCKVERDSTCLARAPFLAAVAGHRRQLQDPGRLFRVDPIPDVHPGPGRRKKQAQPARRHIILQRSWLAGLSVQQQRHRGHLPTYLPTLPPYSLFAVCLPPCLPVTRPSHSRPPALPLHPCLPACSSWAFWR